MGYRDNDHLIMLTTHNVQETRRCKRCHEEKALSDFSKKSIKKYDYVCKQCSNIAAGVMRAALRAMVDEHTGDKCSVCGVVRTEETRSAFHLHHTDPTEKECLISEAVGLASLGRNIDSAWVRVEKELSKTIYLCAFCHSKIHYHQRQP